MCAETFISLYDLFLFCFQIKSELILYFGNRRFIVSLSSLGRKADACWTLTTPPPSQLGVVRFWSVGLVTTPGFDAARYRTPQFITAAQGGERTRHHLESAESTLSDWGKLACKKGVEAMWHLRRVETFKPKIPFFTDCTVASNGEIHVDTFLQNRTRRNSSLWKLCFKIKAPSFERRFAG